MAGRFADGDVESILMHARGSAAPAQAPPAGHSLAAGTSMWSPLCTGTEEGPRIEGPGEGPGTADEQR